MYDFLIVGAGLYGATFARLAKEAGFRCLVLEQRQVVGGNCYSEKVEGIEVHKYGAHIFHTSNEDVYQFAGRFASLRPFVNSPLAFSGEKLYSLPFNMRTFYELWGVTSPEQAMQKIASERLILSRTPANLEEQALALVGTTIYEKLIKYYTTKQWGISPEFLPPDIIKRLPLRFTFDSNYFNDKYQSIPEEGYTQWVQNMLKDIELKLATDFLADREFWFKQAKVIIYSGAIDAFFDYCLGELVYRSLKFSTEYLSTNNFQGNAVINYTDADVKKYPYTRIIEHKHFQPHLHLANKPSDLQKGTVITYEYSVGWHKGLDAYYPVNDLANQKKYEDYQLLAKQKFPQVLFGGRLGRYQYLNMDQVILMAMQDFEKCKKVIKK